jgi:hypothetical protein
MAPRGTTVLGVCVNIGSMLAPSWVPRNQPAHGRRVAAARGCKRRSAHARKGMDRAVGDAQRADKELPGTRGTASDRRGAQTHWHRSRSGSTRSMSSVPTFASFFPTCMIMIEVSITGARGDEQRQFASHPCPAL